MSKRNRARSTPSTIPYDSSKIVSKSEKMSAGRRHQLEGTRVRLLESLRLLGVTAMTTFQPGIAARYLRTERTLRAVEARILN